MFKLKYFWPYILFFCTIVILVVANRIHIKHETHRNLAYTRTLNISGRQRMLSQKLAKMTYQARSGEDVHDTMTEALAVWMEAHDNLLNEKKGLSIYSEGHPEVRDMFLLLAPEFDQLSAAYNSVLSEGRPSDSLLKRISVLEGDYLQKMDAIVFKLESNASADLTESARDQRILAFFSGLLLILEMIVFVYPYHKRLVIAYRKLMRQRIELEEQKNTIQYLYETNELIIEGTNAGIWEWNITTGEEDWSDRFFHILGYERGDIPSNYNTFLHVLLHPDDRTKIINAVDLHLKDHTPYKHEIRMLNKDGQYRWYETSGQAVWNEKGEAIRMAGSIIDITSRVSTREKLYAESHTKDQLLSIVAHDLRSPVNNLASLLSMLKENIIDKDEFLEHVDAISHNVGLLSESMDNMLTWAQGQSKGWQVNASEILVDDAILECVRLYEHVAQEKHVDLIYEPKDMLKAYADFNQVVLILRNILNNALKFTPDNGTISLKTRKEGEYTTVIISDTGRGMDADIVEKLLNKDDIYSTRGTNGEKGTGLGMNLSLDFAERNHCVLSIDSTPGKGTTVYLKIPGKAA